MSDQAAVEAYDQLLSSIGNRAEAIGTKGLASHWPHVGKNYRGLVIAGQALQGWDPAVAGARWHAADATTAEGRAAIIDTIPNLVRRRPRPGRCDRDPEQPSRQRSRTVWLERLDHIAAEPPERRWSRPTRRSRGPHRRPSLG